MSVEQLFDRTVSQDLIDRQKKLVERSHIDRSPVHIVANTYIREAKITLTDISKKLDENQIEVASHKDFVKKISPKLRPTFETNAAGLWMGVALHTFEDILVEKKFYVSHLVAEYNNAIVGTRLGVAKPDNNDAINIENDQWLTLIQCAKEDKSLGNFFSSGFPALPESLRDNLEYSGILEIITDKLVPIYRTQVNNLISSTSKK